MLENPAMSRHTQLILIFFACFFIIIIGLVLYSTDIDYDGLLGLMHSWIDYIANTSPLVLFFCIAILPLFGFPVSPMIIAAGLAYGIGIGFIVVICGTMVNDILGYWIAARFMRGFIEDMVGKRGWKIPQVPPSEMTRVIVLFRLTPGFPLNIQNYLLGLARVPFGKYLFYSFLVQLIPSIGFVITGGSIFDGQWGLIIVGVSIIIIMAIIAKMVYNYRQKNANNIKS